jgi:hypothetical protein
MKDITVLLYWTNMREIISYWIDVLRETTSYWINVQKRANFKQLFCATCRFPHSYLIYVQFAAGITSYFLFDGIKLWNTLIISCLVSIVKYNNTSYCLIQVDTNARTVECLVKWFFYIHCNMYTIWIFSNLRPICQILPFKMFMHWNSRIPKNILSWQIFVYNY